MCVSLDALLHMIILLDTFTLPAAYSLSHLLNSATEDENNRCHRRREQSVPQKTRTIGATEDENNRCHRRREQSVPQKTRTIGATEDENNRCHRRREQSVPQKTRTIGATEDENNRCHRRREQSVPQKNYRQNIFVKNLFLCLQTRTCCYVISVPSGVLSPFTPALYRLITSSDLSSSQADHIV
ncbi:hypothetical protein Hamer_G019771 [Homarus americanus]|uniref:Secreted protein n=1 Tax=Homarus americanus TaxID=6706 RepID=A0A8J5JKM6_HOMAM|nr:hypothetical protein Hamer_G019771 [Homarus americanus]